MDNENQSAQELYEIAKQNFYNSLKDLLYNLVCTCQDLNRRVKVLEDSATPAEKISRLRGITIEVRGESHD